MFYFRVKCNSIKIFVLYFYDSWRWLSSRNMSDGKYTFYEMCVFFAISHSVSSWKHDDIFDLVNSQELQDFFSFQNFTSITELAKTLSLVIGRNYFCVYLTWRVHWTLQVGCGMKKWIEESLVNILIKRTNICYNFSTMQCLHLFQKSEGQVRKFSVLYVCGTSVLQC